VDEVDAAHHLLEEEQVPHEEQRPVCLLVLRGLTLGSRGLCGDERRGVDERLAAQGDGLARKVLKDGVLRGGGT